jgi:hypothetical protein
MPHVAEFAESRDMKKVSSGKVVLPTNDRVFPIDAASPLFRLVLLEVDLFGIPDDITLKGEPSCIALYRKAVPNVSLI